MGGASCFHEGQQGKLHKWRGGDGGQVKGADEKMVGGGEGSGAVQTRCCTDCKASGRKCCSEMQGKSVLRGLEEIYWESPTLFAGVLINLR